MPMMQNPLLPCPPLPPFHPNQQCRKTMQIQTKEFYSVAATPMLSPVYDTVCVVQWYNAHPSFIRETITTLKVNGS